jgi:hypothetical protein
MSARWKSSISDDFSKKALSKENLNPNSLFSLSTKIITNPGCCTSSISIFYSTNYDYSNA